MRTARSSQYGGSVRAVYLTDPPRQSPPDRVPHWTETPFLAETPWTETPPPQQPEGNPPERTWDQAARQEETSYRDPPHLTSPLPPTHRQNDTRL